MDDKPQPRWTVWEHADGQYLLVDNHAYRPMDEAFGDFSEPLEAELMAKAYNDPKVSAAFDALSELYGTVHEDWAENGLVDLYNAAYDDVIKRLIAGEGQ